MLNPSASLVMSTSVLEALPGKLDIKRHSPSNLYKLKKLGAMYEVWEAHTDRKRRKYWIAVRMAMTLVKPLVSLVSLPSWLQFKFNDEVSTHKNSFATFLAHLSRRLRGELLVYQWLRRPSVVRLSVNIFKHLLLWNHWANQTQISYGDSLGWGNESLFKCSWSHDQDGHHAHIW